MLLLAKNGRNDNLAWPQVFSPMAIGWMALKSARSVYWIPSKVKKLTSRVNLGVPWARVKFIRNAVAVIVPKASITRSIMVVVHLFRVGNEGAVVLNVRNPIVVRIRITVVADAIVVGVKLIGVVGIRAIVILVGYSIQVPVKAIITCVAWNFK